MFLAVNELKTYLPIRQLPSKRCLIMSWVCLWFPFTVTLIVRKEKIHNENHYLEKFRIRVSSYHKESKAFFLIELIDSKLSFYAGRARLQS